MKGSPKPGKTLSYEIVIENHGPRAYPAGDFIVRDTLPPGLTYVDGTAKYSDDAGQTYFDLDNDVSGESVFMIDEGGLSSPRDMQARGAIHKIKYDAVIDDPLLDIVQLRNDVQLEFPDEEETIDYSVRRNIKWGQSINLENTVYLGEEREGGCDNAVETVEELHGTDVTYCFNVTNDGETYLDEVTLTNSGLGIEAGDFTFPNLKPGEYKLVTFQTTIEKTLTNTAVVSANPLFDNWNDIWTLNDVKSTDSSRALLRQTPALTDAPTPAPDIESETRNGSKGGSGGE